MPPIRASLGAARLTFAFVDRANVSTTSVNGADARSHGRRRAIGTIGSLLASCVQSRAEGSHCFRARFPPDVPFAESLSRLQDASALLGMHGSGLMNVVFMRSGSIGQGTAAVASHPLVGVDKYDFLASELGIDHVQIHAREEFRVAASSHPELLQLRVRLNWSVALARGDDRYSPWVPRGSNWARRTGARGAADGAAAEHTSWGVQWYQAVGRGSRARSSQQPGHAPHGLQAPRRGTTPRAACMATQRQMALSMPTIGTVARRRPLAWVHARAAAAPPAPLLVLQSSIVGSVRTAQSYRYITGTATLHATSCTACCKLARCRVCQIDPPVVRVVAISVPAVCTEIPMTVLSHICTHSPRYRS